MPKYLTLEESAERLGVDYKTIYRLVRAGELPAGRVGRIYRVREEDIDAYFERQQRQVAEETRTLRPLRDRRCGACNAKILSELSVGGGCSECGCDICQGCWSVRKVRRCSVHGVSGGQHSADDLPAPPDVPGPAQQAVPGGGHGAETPERAVRRLQESGVPALTADEALLAENGFLRAFAQRLEQVEELTDPLSGRVIILRRARVRHTIRPERCPDSGPAGAVSTFDLRTGGWGKPKTRIVLQARVAARQAAFVRQGYDAQPLGEADLAPLLDELADCAQKARCFHLMALASFTGWTKEALQRVTDRRRSRAFDHRYAAVVLTDLSADHVAVDESDERLPAFWPVVAPALYAERVGRCEEMVREMLAGRRSLKLTEAVSACKAPAPCVQAAFHQVSAGGDEYAVDRLEGIGVVISRRA